MIAQDFAELVDDARRSGTGYAARCPAHEDRHRSLSFTDGQAALVVKCHAGCTIEAICAALGVTVRDLFPAGTNGASRPATGARTVVATYDYRDVDGRLLYQAVRFDPKGFAQRRPDGSGGWIWNLEGVPRVLYRLPELQGRAEVLVVEGEKDADRLYALGLLATTNAMGAGKWQDAYSEQLRQAGCERAVLLGDNDQAGVAHLETVGRSLSARGVAVRLLRLPDLPPVRDKHGEDVSNWLEAGHTAEDLRPLIAEAPAFPADQPSPRTAPPEPIELTALLARQYPDHPGIVAGGLVVRQGLIVTGGAPKLGKSCLVSNLVIARHRGEPWLGFATTPGRTLVIQAEIPEPELQKRLGIMLKDGTCPATGSVYFLTDRRIKLDRPEGLAALRQHLDRLAPDLLVIDPLARFFSGEENSAKDMGALVAALDVLIQEYAVTILLVHHVGKPGADGREGGQRLRGSSALFGAADTVMLLDRTETGFKLAFELRHGPEPDPLYLTRTPTLWFVPAGPPEDLMACAWLVASGPLRPTQLVAAIRKDRNVGERAAWTLLARTKKANLIASDADGYYCTTALYCTAKACSTTSPR